VHRPAAAQDLRAMNGGMFSRPSLFMLVINAKGETATALAALKLGRRFLGIEQN